MWKTPVRRPSGLGLLAGALFLLSLPLLADISIDQVEIDKQSQPLPANAVTPVRISAAAQSIQFHFTEADREGQPTTRLRYKLEGYDTTWRDLVQEHGMKVVLQFWDNGTKNETRVVGGDAFLLNGETPGWRGSVEQSDFISRSGTATAPGRAASVKVVVISQGYLPSIGLVAIDAVRLRIEHPEEGGRVEEYDLTVTEGSGLNDPMGCPVNWNRQGSRAEMAQLRLRPGPVPHPVLVLNDTSASYFANWVTDVKRPMLVHPGDRLTLTWQTAHSIGGCGPGVADYPPLKPGNYRFRVAPAKANGELTGPEVSLPVVVVEPLYHRWEFWLTLLLLAGGERGMVGTIHCPTPDATATGRERTAKSSGAGADPDCPRFA